MMERKRNWGSELFIISSEIIIINKIISRKNNNICLDIYYVSNSDRGQHRYFYPHILYTLEAVVSWGLRISDGQNG